MNSHSLSVLEFEKVRRMLVRWTFSIPGRELASRLAPLDGLDAIRIASERIDEWKELELVGETPDPDPIEDLRPHFARLQRGNASLTGAELFEFTPLLGHLKRLRRLNERIAQGPTPRPRLEAILRDVTDFKQLADRLGRSISPAGEVLDSASSAIARIRRQLFESQRSASDLLSGLLGRLSNDRREESYVTLRDGRYVVSIRSQSRELFPGLLHGRSQTGQSVLIEPLEAVEANNAVSELGEEEKAEEARILRELSEALRGRIGELESAYRAVGLLDLVRAEAKLALELRGNAPALNDAGRLRIVAGRHPILAEAEARGGSVVVPLDLSLERERPVLLISGPNMGGKSVALKTVGLLATMAVSGLHVPADPGSEFPLVDDIFVDLGDEQSIEDDLSTFAGHLRNVGDVWSRATGESLVLLDELGGGTDPEEGAALAMALLEGMSRRRCLTVATTHLTSIKLFVGDRPGMENASMEFDAVSLRPRFVLKMGEPGRSRAFDIARRILPESDLLQRAEEYRSPVLVKMDQLFTRIDEEKRKLVEERRKLEEQRDELHETTLRREKQVARLRQRIETLREVRETAVDEVYREAAEEVRAIRDRLEKEVEKAPSRVGVLGEARRAEREIARRGFERKDRRERQPRGRRLVIDRIVPGVQAWLPEVGAVVQVERVDRVAKKAWVDWHGRRIEVGVLSLEEIPQEIAETIRDRRPSTEFRVRLEVADDGPISMELDLRGCRVDEAMEKLERFLDRAVMKRLGQIRIIHGKGTGTLKREVEGALGRHPLIDQYRTGELGEGGWGVTVVDLSHSEG